MKTDKEEGRAKVEGEGRKGGKGGMERRRKRGVREETGEISEGEQV